MPRPIFTPQHDVIAGGAGFETGWKQNRAGMRLAGVPFVGRTPVSVEQGDPL